MKARIIHFQKKSFSNYIIFPASLLNLKKNGTLSSNDIAIIGYLLNLYSEYDGIQVTQKCISEHTKLSTGAIKNIINKLYDMGFIDVIQSNWDGRKKKREANVYKLKNPLLDTSGGFFYIPRFIFNMELSPKVLLVYFFMCHSQNYEYDKSWNSYSDISKKLKLNRSEVIKLVKELENSGLIFKKHKIIRKRGKGNCYADNRYSVKWLSSFVENVINSLTKKTPNLNSADNIKNNIKSFWRNFERRAIEDKTIKISSFFKKLRIREIRKDKPLKRLVEQLFLEEYLYLDYPF